MKSKLNKKVTAALILLAMNANAASFKGYNKDTSVDALKYTEKVQRMSETKKDLLILISGQAGLYKFPKTVSYFDEVKNYLSDSMKAKKTLVFEIDPTTAKILRISEAPK